MNRAYIADVLFTPVAFSTCTVNVSNEMTVVLFRDTPSRIWRRLSGSPMARKIFPAIDRYPVSLLPSSSYTVQSPTVNYVKTYSTKAPVSITTLKLKYETYRYTIWNAVSKWKYLSVVYQLQIRTRNSATAEKARIYKIALSYGAKGISICWTV